MAILLLVSSAVRAAELEVVIPHPQGWLGTVNDWARGLGIGFAVLNLAILVAAWVLLRRGGLTTGLKQLLPFGIAVLPLATTFFGYHYGLEAAKSVQACGACHVMTPFVRDLRDPSSGTLAAVHFKNRYIQENQCYTCHTGYGIYGSVRAKLDGLGQLIRYTAGRYTLPIRIDRPYSNVRCLHCHGGSQKFLQSAAHPPEMQRVLVAGDVSCLDCHAPAHPPPAQRVSR